MDARESTEIPSAVRSPNCGAGAADRCHIRTAQVVHRRVSHPPRDGGPMAPLTPAVQARECGRRSGGESPPRAVRRAQRATHLSGSDPRPTTSVVSMRCSVSYRRSERGGARIAQARARFAVLTSHNDLIAGSAWRIRRLYSPIRISTLARQESVKRHRQPGPQLLRDRTAGPGAGPSEARSREDRSVLIRYGCRLERSTSPRVLARGDRDSPRGILCPSRCRARLVAGR